MCRRVNTLVSALTMSITRPQIPPRQTTCQGGKPTIYRCVLLKRYRYQYPVGLFFFEILNRTWRSFLAGIIKRVGTPPLQQLTNPITNLLKAHHYQRLKFSKRALGRVSINHHLIIIESHHCRRQPGHGMGVSPGGCGVHGPQPDDLPQGPSTTPAHQAGYKQLVTFWWWISIPVINGTCEYKGQGYILVGYKWIYHDILYDCMTLYDQYKT